MRASLRLGSLVDAHYRDRAQLHRILELGKLVQATAALIHELQRERGLSSGFTASSGARFVAELPAQRPRTDAALGHAYDAWDVQDQELTSQVLVSTFSSVREELQALDQLRQDVDALAVPTATVVQRFTGLIDRLMVVTSEAPGTSPHPQVTLALISLFHFALAKEFTGQERALGSAICAQGEWEPFQAEQFGRIGRRRQDAVEVFARHASAEQIAAWEALRVGETSRSLEDLRTQLAAAADTGGPTPDPLVWFERSTAFIDALRSFEKDLLTDLDHLCLHVLAEARSAWEDSREVPEQRETLVLRRLERTQARLLTERQVQRRGRAEPPAPDLAAGSGQAVETVHRWSRDLDRLNGTVKALEALARRAQILSLDASIEAIRRSDVAAGAKGLQQDLLALGTEVDEMRRILIVSATRASQALEAFHSTVLGQADPERNTP